MTTLRAPIGPPVGLPRPGEVRIVDVPERRMIAIHGCGTPESGAFQGAIETLFSLGYTIHFALRRDRGVEAPVGTLEGLYDLSEPDAEGEFGDWTLMLPLPDDATPSDVDRAIAELRVRKRLTGLDRVRVERFREGLAAETMHVGPYDAEAPTIDRLHTGLAARGYRAHGRHHEIYVGDPRRAAPDKLRTVIRQPIL
jgi:hypothetical protein